MPDELPPPPEPQNESTTFSGLDHRMAVEKARLNGEPEPEGFDPQRPATDPFKAAYENRIKEK